jgi:5-oxoprolinase (ATP-hydrolysing)
MLLAIPPWRHKAHTAPTLVCQGVLTGLDIVIEAVSVESVGGGSKFKEPTLRTTTAAAKAVGKTKIFCEGAWKSAPVYNRAQLKPGQMVKGPALITEAHNTTVVEPGWQGKLTAKLHLVLTRAKKLARRHAIGTTADPVMLEIFNNLFRAVAEEMGITLQNTSYSVNIKERLDFSCAVFDQQGQLVANAPHIPVHLGSMGESVRSLIEAKGDRIYPGDVYLQNNPYNGGTHLPDITVITPVFLEETHPYPSRSGTD